MTVHVSYHTLDIIIGMVYDFTINSPLALCIDVDAFQKSLPVRARGMADIMGGSKKPLVCALINVTYQGEHKVSCQSNRETTSRSLFLSPVLHLSRALKVE